ncbi:tRNA 2-selenouridine(34) synthase MnmH [Alkalicoccus daliensis]|uniref:tRNA 2-selenouridine synthase n=1 Tax=Alkalicoccus daliensis TaxID=745820 RepID=A0A1H0ACA6_9BACI|nr:tRNA 2-selenouridine(34) synthase MnmH [Alkalicoccus daliensis]SDN30934.1 tRNA 2-selenouridine synthase [Alkalicoccus daliensis]
MTSIYIPSVPFNEIDDKNTQVIDVRSPAEYKEFHIPGSINLPLFTDEERATVGTAYKQDSPDKAKSLGIEIFSAKLPGFYRQIIDLKKNNARELVITCARGGMRSGSFVSLINSLDIPVKRLEGGMRSVRQYVQEELSRLSSLSWKMVVISGHTGTRKTVWLEKLHEEGYPVLNLEKLANHRGSIFGHIGKDKRSQKEFEWLLVGELQRLEKEEYVLIEAESKRIGPIILPEWLQEKKEYGRFIELTDNMDRRVQYLLEEYQPQNHKESFHEALNKLKKRLKPAAGKFIEEAEKKDDYYSIFKCLLENYYDPSYSHKQTGYIEKDYKRYLNISDLKEEDILPLLQSEIMLEVKKV